MRRRNQRDNLQGYDAESSKRIDKEVFMATKERGCFARLECLRYFVLLLNEVEGLISLKDDLTHTSVHTRDSARLAHPTGLA